MKLSRALGCGGEGGGGPLLWSVAGSGWRVVPFYLTIWNLGYPTPHSQNPFGTCGGGEDTRQTRLSRPPPQFLSLWNISSCLCPSPRHPSCLSVLFLLPPPPNPVAFYTFSFFALISIPLFFATPTDSKLRLAPSGPGWKYRGTSQCNVGRLRCSQNASWERCVRLCKVGWCRGGGGGPSS